MRKQLGANPSGSTDAATKGYVDDADTDIYNFITGLGTSVATANAVVRRDASSRAQFADPSAAQDAATKNYVDGVRDADSWKAPVLVASTANLTLSAPGSTIDGVTPGTGERVLVKDQTTASENGIYVFNSSGSPMTRASDTNTGTELVGAVVAVRAGTANGGTVWRQTSYPITIGTTGVVWSMILRPMSSNVNNLFMVVRDSNGRFQASDPSASADVATKNYVDGAVGAQVPPGSTVMWPAPAPPTGWLVCDGSAVSRTTYAALFAAVNPALTTGGVISYTSGTPGTWNWASHGMQTGQAIYFSAATSLPAALSLNTVYYVISVTTSTFRLATTQDNALAGTAIAYATGASSTVTIRATWGVGDGSTTFNVPDLRGKVPTGLDASQSEFASVGRDGGEKTHTLTAAEIPAHSHPVALRGQVATDSTSGANMVGADGANVNATSVTGSTNNNTGGDGAHNVLSPYRVMNFIIKT